jgi:hypothetical protein
MSRPLIAVAALTKKSVNDKVQMGESIVTSLQANPTVFVTPKPTVTEIEDATRELHDANKAAATGSYEGKQRLLKAETEFNRLIGVYLDYVNMTAKGDGVIIEQSGLDVSRTAQKAGPTPMPENLKVGGVTPRELTAAVDSVERAKAYIWQYYIGDMPPADEKDWWLAEGTPKAKITLTGLTTKTEVWVRCAAVGTLGQGPWCAPQSRVVL